MFFARSLSLRDRVSNPASASTVIDVSATWWTCHESSVPSSRGLWA